MTANELFFGIAMKVIIAAPLVIAYIIIAERFDRLMLNMHVKRIRDRRSES